MATLGRCLRTARAACAAGRRRPAGRLGARRPPRPAAAAAAPDLARRPGGRGDAARRRGPHPAGEIAATGVASHRQRVEEGHHAAARPGSDGSRGPRRRRCRGRRRLWRARRGGPGERAHAAAEAVALGHRAAGARAALIRTDRSAAGDAGQRRAYGRGRLPGEPRLERAGQSGLPEPHRPGSRRPRRGAERDGGRAGSERLAQTRRLGERLPPRGQQLRHVLLERRRAQLARLRRRRRASLAAPRSAACRASTGRRRATRRWRGTRRATRT